MKAGIIATLALAMAVSGAQAKTPFKPMTQAELDTALEMGDEMEATAVGDLNGDNDVDTVFIVSSPDARNLYVALASRKDVPLRHVPAGNLKLQPGNSSPAQLSIHNGVLTVDDRLDGMSVVYRYRGEKAKPKMRLIGLDVSRYPDGGEDGRSMSWNLVTGAVETASLRETRTGFDAIYKTKKTKKSPILYMEKTPDPESELIGMTMAK